MLTAAVGTCFMLSGEPLILLANMGNIGTWHSQQLLCGWRDWVEGVRHMALTYTLIHVGLLSLQLGHTALQNQKHFDDNGAKIFNVRNVVVVFLMNMPPIPQ